MIGLGRLAAASARRLIREGRDCVAYDSDADRVYRLVRHEAAEARSIAELIGNLQPPRIVLLLLPEGDLTADAIVQLAGELKAGHVTIDAGDGHYQDDLLRHEPMPDHGVDLVDCGTCSGTMLGGSREVFDHVGPIMHMPTPNNHGSYIYCRSGRAGHFVSMVHNSIENGGTQSLIEAFDLLNRADSFGYEVPLTEIASSWRCSNVTSTRVRELAGHGTPFSEHAIAELYRRLRSEVSRSFAERTLTAIRLAMGGECLQTRPPLISH